MESMYVIIMAGGAGSRLEPLTRDRAKPAVPFAGNLRIIDFVLNNMINSGARDIGVLLQAESHSLQRHINKGYDLGRLGTVELYYAPLKNGNDRYISTANAVVHNLRRIPDYANEVAVFGGDHVYKMDVSLMQDFHLEQGAAITISATPAPIEQGNRFGVIEADSDSRITGFKEKPPGIIQSIYGEPDKVYVSMGNYIFDKRTMLMLLSEDNAKETVSGKKLDELLLGDPDARDKYSSHDFGKDIIPLALRKGLKVVAYDFRSNMIPGAKASEALHYWKDVGTIPEYWAANMDLCDPTPELNLYNHQWPIMSAPIVGPPAKTVHNYDGRIGSPLESLMGVGSIISGSTVEHSIIGPFTTIHSYAHVKDSIVFGGLKLGETDIGGGSQLIRVIMDSGVQVPPGTQIGYNQQDDIARGFTTVNIGDNNHITVVPRGYKFENK